MSPAPWSPEDVLSIWTVYRRPADLPMAPFVARRHEATQEGPRRTADVVTGETLSEVRAKLPPGLVLFPRFEGDLPHVVESWL